MAMTMAVRNLGSRLAYSAARVWCGIEPTRRSHVSFLSDKEFPFSKNPSLTHSPSDLPARCQASVSVCPLPTRQSQDYGVRTLEHVDAEPEMRSIEDTPAASPAFFFAEAAIGLVECSGRGCRPLYTYAVPESLQTMEDATQVASSRSNVYPSLTRGTVTERTLKTAQNPPKVDTSAVKMAFDAALQAAPRDAQLLSEFATFKWNAMGDVDGAEELFNKALEVSPDDPNILASFALFLWQSDE